MEITKKVLYWILGLNIVPVMVLAREWNTFESLWHAYLLGWAVQFIMAILILVVGTALHFFYKSIGW
jgi:hypothetical protein